MSKLYTVKPGKDHQAIFSPGEGDCRWLGLEYLQLAAGSSWSAELKDREAAIVILSGSCSVSVEAKESRSWEGIGGRPDVFGGPGAAVYVPRASRATVTAGTAVEAAVAVAPCQADLPPALIAPADVKVLSSGAAGWRRDVRLYIPPGSGVSSRLIVGETLNPQGNWSGIPPHKHDEVSSTENLLEEFYLFKTRPESGFGVQLMYREGEKGEAVVVGNNDVAFFSGGYHPTVAAPGVTLSYTWALSGESKDYNLSIDSRFGWVPSAEMVLKEMKRS